MHLAAGPGQQIQQPNNAKLNQGHPSPAAVPSHWLRVPSSRALLLEGGHCEHFGVLAVQPEQRGVLARWLTARRGVRSKT